VEVTDMVVVDKPEAQPRDAASTEQRTLIGRTLPAARIVFVPFTLVEVEQTADDDRR